MSTYSYTYGFDDPAAAGILAVLGGFLIVILLIGLLAYILFALGLSRIAKLRGLDNSFLAWIPVAQSYLLGQVADDICSRQGKQTNYRTILLVLNIVSIAGGLIPIIGSLAAFGCSIAYVVFQAIALYAIYKDYSPDNAVIMLVTSIIFTISWIFLFAIRNKQPVTLGGGQYPGGPGAPGGYNGYNPYQNYNGYQNAPGSCPPPAGQQPYQVPRPVQPAPQQPAAPEEPNKEGENPNE